MNEFTKVAGDKINTQKSILFLWSCNERSKSEIKKAILLIISSKRLKCLEINLIREVKDLYTENNRTLLKEIKDLDIWKYGLYSWIEILKSHRFNGIFIKIPVAFFFFFKDGKAYPPISVELHRTLNGQNNLERGQQNHENSCFIFFPFQGLLQIYNK